MAQPIDTRCALKIFAAGLLSFAACEVAVSLLPLRPYSTETELLVSYQSDRLARVSDGDIVLLGDSSLGNAVDEQALSAALGVRCWNLSLVGFFGPDGDGYLLDELARLEIRPGAVVLMHEPAGWTQRRSEISLRALEQRFGKNSLEKAGSRLFGELPSVSVSRSCKRALFSPGDGLRPNPGRYRSAIENQQRAESALPEHRYIPQGETLDWETTTPVPWVQFVPDDASSSRLSTLVELASAISNDVLLASGPSWEGGGVLSKPYLSALEKWLREFCAQDVRAEPLYSGVPLAGNSLMGDSANHLNARGKAEFTAWLAEVLRQRLDGAAPARAWRGE